jgi:HSP20 family protein
MTITYSTPFDVLFKNFFESDSTFDLIRNTKPYHPVDIYETDAGLIFEVAATGLTKDDISITLNQDVLQISYKKNSNEDESSKKYIYKSIARRSFDLGWKVSSRYSVQNSIAKMENGLLTITVPFAKEQQTKTLTIN